jgi:DNA polymerase-3 subunit beta
MKVTCIQTELNSHLAFASRAVSSRPSHPVLANVLLVADEETQHVSLTGFDLSLGVQTTFPAQVDESGKLTLPAKLLTDIVSRLPNGEITLEDEEDKPLVTLTCATGRYQVLGLAADEYPELPKVEDGEMTQLSAESLSEGLRGSLFATSADESKQVLTGVHLIMEADGLEFAATDGHRLAVVQTLDPEMETAPQDPPATAKKRTKTTKDISKFAVTVPNKALRELERMLNLQHADSVTVHFDQGQLIFAWEHQRLTSRLLEGQYPNYRQLIPSQFIRQMTLERKLFISALERIAVLADQKNNIVKLSIDSVQQCLTLSVDAPDVGSGQETIAAQISGEDLDIAFNVKYLLEGLKVFNTTEVQMQFNSSTSPSIVTPLGGVKMTYLVMPVQIRS